MKAGGQGGLQVGGQCVCWRKGQAPGRKAKGASAFVPDSESWTTEYWCPSCWLGLWHVTCFGRQCVRGCDVFQVKADMPMLSGRFSLPSPSIMRTACPQGTSGSQTRVVWRPEPYIGQEPCIARPSSTWQNASQLIDPGTSNTVCCQCP